MINRYPYTDAHELNLDFILRKMRELEIDFHEFEVVNKIRFEGAWDITKQYPAWSLVSDNNIGYISIRPVPVGVPLTDNSYWRVMIDYTSQIADLQNRVVNLENDVNTIDNTTIPAIQSDINALESKVFLSSRKFLFVGDSYASQTESWVPECVNYAGITNYDNIAVTGTAFYDGSFRTQLVNYTGDRNEITDIVVGGGLNDSIFKTSGSDLTTLINAIESFANYAKANYPNATLWLAYMGNAIDDAPLLSGRDCECRIWARWTYERYGREKGFNIITGCSEALAVSKSNFKADHIHPSSYGAYEIGACVANGLLNCSKVALYPIYDVSVSPAGNNVLSNVTMDYSMENGFFNFTIGDNFHVAIATDHPTFNSATKIPLVKLGRVYFNKKYIVPVMGRLDYFNTIDYANTQMVLEFYQDTVSMYVDQIKSDGSTFETYTAGSVTSGPTIQRGITFSVPAWYVN